MAKFIRVSSGASGMTNEGVYLSVKDVHKVTSVPAASAVLFKDASATVTLSTSENAGDAIIDHLANSKSAVIDIASMGRGVKGVLIPVLTVNSEVANTEISVAADLVFTLAGATVGLNYTATLTQGEGEAEVKAVVTGEVSDAAEAITFPVADLAGFAAGAADLVLVFSTPNQPLNTYTHEHTATLTA